MFREDNNFEDLNEMHQKIANQSLSSFEERKEEINKSKNVFVGAVAGITLAAIVGWLVLSPKYEAGNSAEVPVVRRPQTVAKLQPTDPGGMEILNQDKTVYDIIDKKGDDTESVESLLPPPEEPKMPEIVDIADEENLTPATEEIEIVRQIEEPVEEVRVAQIEPEVVKIIEPEKGTEKAVEAKEEPKTEKLELPKKVSVPQIEEPEDESKSYKFQDFKQVNAANPNRYNIEIKSDDSVTKASAPAEEAKTVAKAETNAAAAPQAKGMWQVQLMSSPNKAAIEKSWGDLAKKYSVLAAQPHEIEEADLGAKGVFYRLRAGAFSSRAGADELCNDIKALGGTCIVNQKK